MCSAAINTTMERAFRVLTPTIKAVRMHGSRTAAPFPLGGDLPQWKKMAASSLSTVQGSDPKGSPALSANVAGALKSAYKPDDILAIVRANQLTGDEASLALAALRNSAQGGELSSDGRFVKLLDRIQGEVKNLSQESIVRSLINLAELDHRRHPTSQLMEAECRKRLRTMTPRHLSLLVCNHSRLSRGLTNESLRLLQLRWREMGSPFLLKRLLKTSLRLSPAFAERLEDKTLEMVDSYSFVDLVEVAGYFTAARRISTLVMQTICYAVEEQRGQWETSGLLRLIAHMGYSRYHNSHFFKDVAAFCQENLAKCTNGQIAEIVRSFGMLRMPEEELFAAVLEHLQSDLTEFSLAELQTIASGFSMVNIKPPAQLVKRLAQEFGSLSFTQKIEFCLALAVFGASPVDQMEEVFKSTEAVNGLMDSDKPWQIPTQLKLLQLNAHARRECPGYQGPYLPEGLTRYPNVSDLATSNLQRDVTSKVETILGDKKFLETNVGLDSGYIIGAEIAVDSDGTPYSAVDYNISGSSRNRSVLRKDLPQDASRVAVIINGPTCYLYNSSELTGRRALMVRQLQALGYKLIQVPFNEWSAMKSDTEKLEYLQEKFKGVIKCLNR